MPSRLRGSLVGSAHWVVSSSCTVSALPVAWSITAPSVSLQLFSASRTTSTITTGMMTRFAFFITLYPQNIS